MLFREFLIMAQLRPSPYDVVGINPPYDYAADLSARWRPLKPLRFFAPECSRDTPDASEQRSRPPYVPAPPMGIFMVSIS